MITNETYNALKGQGYYFIVSAFMLKYQLMNISFVPFSS